MRILILASRYPPLAFGGHGERCRQTVSMLAKRGHSVQVLTSNHRLPSQGLPLERGVRRRLLLYGSPAEGFGQLLKREKFNVGLMHDTLVAFRPDCVFVWEMRDLSKSLLFFLQNSGIPVLYDLHSTWLLEDFESDPWNRWWRGPASFSRVLRRGFLRLTGRSRSLRRRYPWGGADAIDLANAFVCSDRLRHLLAASGLPVEPLDTVFPATDDQLIPRKPDYDGAERFMWAGRLGPEKDPGTVIEAVGILRRRGRPVSLYLYIQGEQLERKRLRARIDETGAGDYIHIRHIRPTELLEHFAAFDAFVSTSGEEDPFPMTVLEAMLAGLPCIAARSGAVNELVREGEHCLGFDFGDPESLAGTLEKYCEKPDHGADMALRCREWLQESCVLNTALPKIEKRLAEAAGARTAPTTGHVDNGNANTARGGVRPRGPGDRPGAD